MSGIDDRLETQQKEVRMRKIIGFTGKAGVGKDTCTDYLEWDGLQNGEKWVVMGFADAVKEAALAIDPWVLIDEPGRPQVPMRLSDIVSLLGWDDAKKNPEVRRLLQKIGTEAGRDLHGPDCWINIFERHIATFPDDVNVTVRDVRFTNEANAIQLAGGVVVEVRGTSRRPTTGEASSHASEAGIDQSYVDYVIYNTGTIEDLHRHVKTCVESDCDDRTVFLGEAP